MGNPFQLANHSSLLQLMSCLYHLVPGAHKKVIGLPTETNLQLSAADLYKYV